MDDFKPFIEDSVKINNTQLKNNGVNKNLENFPVYSETINMIVQSDKYMSNFDGNHRIYSNEYRTACIEILKLICSANSTSDKLKKVEIVEQALGQGDYLKIVVRIMFDLRLISQDVRNAIDYHLGSINSQLCGWLKSVKEKL